MDDGVDVDALPVEEDRVFAPLEAFEQGVGELQLAAQDALDHSAVHLPRHRDADRPHLPRPLSVKLPKVYHSSSASDNREMQKPAAENAPSKLP